MLLHRGTGKRGAAKKVTWTVKGGVSNSEGRGARSERGVA